MTNWRFYNEHENEKKYSYKSNNISNKHEIWNSKRIVLLIGFGLGLFKSDIFKSFFQHRTSPDNFNDLLYPKNKNLPLRQITPVNNSIDFNDIPKFPKMDLKNFQNIDIPLKKFNNVNREALNFDVFKEFKPIDLKSNDFKLKEFKPIDLKSNDFKLNDE